MQEAAIHGARAAADTLGALSRGARDDAPKPDNRMKIVMLARRVAAVREELERHAARLVNE